MAFSTYKELLEAEFNLPGYAEYLQALSFHWDRFGYVGNEELQYLLTKRAIARYTLVKFRTAVDVEIGFDKVSTNQLIKNAQAIIADTTREISSSFPGFSEAPTLVSASGDPGLSGE